MALKLKPQMAGIINAFIKAAEKLAAKYEEIESKLTPEQKEKLVEVGKKIAEKITKK